MEAELEQLWADWRRDTDAASAEAERVRDESNRRRAIASSSSSSSSTSDSSSSSSASSRGEVPDKFRKGGQAYLGKRRYRSMLPKGIATALAAHCGLPPGQKIADVQRALCEIMVATAVDLEKQQHTEPVLAPVSVLDSVPGGNGEVLLSLSLSPTASTEDILRHVDVVGVEELARRGRCHRS